jgi:hypothetical protein
VRNAGQDRRHELVRVAGDALGAGGRSHGDAELLCDAGVGLSRGDEFEHVALSFREFVEGARPCADGRRVA